MRCTSVPTPVARAAGSMPTVATVAVIRTGLKRSTAPERTASRKVSLPSHPVDVGDHDNAVLHGHAEEGDEADGGGDVERLAPQVERDQAAQGGKRHHPEEQDRLAHLAELGKKEDDHKRQHDAHDQGQPRLGALLALELASPLQAVFVVVETDGLVDLACASLR